MNLLPLCNISAHSSHPPLSQPPLSFFGWCVCLRRSSRLNIMSVLRQRNYVHVGSSVFAFLSCLTASLFFAHLFSDAGKRIFFFLSRLTTLRREHGEFSQARQRETARRNNGGDHVLQCLAARREHNTPFFFFCADSVHFLPTLTQNNTCNRKTGHKTRQPRLGWRLCGTESVQVCCAADRRLVTLAWTRQPRN